MRRLLWSGVLASAILLTGFAPAHAIITDTTIYDIRQGMHAINDTVRVHSVVVTGVDVRPTTYGVYVQEQAGGPFSGILAYRSSSFPGYENSADPVLVGDVIDVEGVYTEYTSGANGISELNSPLLYKVSSGPVPTPVTISPCSLHMDAPVSSERWEGVLVKVENVVVGRLDSFNDWYLDMGDCGNLLRPSRADSVISGYEKMISGQVVPQVGDTLASVVGIAQWEYSERRIAPRNSDDIVFASQGPAPVPNLVYSSAENQIKVRFNVSLDPTTAQNTGNYSLSTFETITGAVYDDPSKTVTLTTSTNLVPDPVPTTLSMSSIRNANDRIMEGVQTYNFIGGISTIPFIQTPVSASNDTSQVVGQQVSFRGVVTASGDGVEFPAGIGFYVQDRSATEYAGIFVYGAPSTPVRGDSVFVSGIVTEFGVGPETEITSVDEVTVYASGVTDVAPIDVTVAQINGSTLSESEKYESTLVRIQGVTTISANFPGGYFDVDQAGQTIRVDNLAIDDTAYQPLFEDVVDVTGVIRFSGTAPNRRLQPRNWNEPPVGDIHVVSKSAVSDAPPAVYHTLLAQNEPNPFNPTTRISYSIGTPGHASLRVYDLQGRLVATLLERDVQVGPGSVVWNGLDNKGRRVPSGVYVYRLRNADGDLSHKMVLLK